jgi:hypothetical protein
MSAYDGSYIYRQLSGSGSGGSSIIIAEPLYVNGEPVLAGDPLDIMVSFREVTYVT